MLKKKVLSILLVVVMVFSALPMNVFAAEEELPTVIRVESAESGFRYHVPYKTPFEDLELPSQVSLVLDNEEKLPVDVMWDSSTYSPKKCYWQGVKGTFTPPEGVNCDPTITAEFDVYVEEPEIVWIEELEPVTVKYGCPNIHSILTEKYSSLKIRDKDGYEYTMEIMWTGECTTYDPFVPGRHTLMGHLSGEPWNWWITTYPQAYVDVIVREPIEIESLGTLEPLFVPYGTDSVALGKLLRSSRPSVTVNGTEDRVGIRWDVDNSDYNSKEPGTYTIIGTPSDIAYSNSQNHKVEIEVQVTKSVREYIYEVYPLHGFRVKENTSEEQIKEMLKEKYATVTVVSSQMKEYEIPVIWSADCIDTKHPGYEATGELDLSDFPYLINKGELCPKVTISKGFSEYRHITNVEVEIEDKVVPFGTPFSETGLPQTAAVSFEGQEETQTMDLIWQNYDPYYVGEQRLVATLNLEYGGVDCDRNWRWETTVTVLPPEGIKSITASEVKYVLPFEQYHDGNPTLKNATVVLEDGTEKQLPISWKSNYGEIAESGLCGKCAVSLPGSRRYGTVNLSSLDGFSNLGDVTAIFEVVESRNITEKNIVSVGGDSYTYKFLKGQPLSYISEQLKNVSVNVTVDVAGQQISTSCNAIWDAEHSDIDINTPGKYTVNGRLDLSNTEFLDPSGLTATKTIKISDKCLIIDKPAKERYSVDISVEAGTSKETLRKHLQEEYGIVKMYTTWRIAVEVPAIWDVEHSEYQDSEGIYIIDGILDLSSQPFLWNPKNVGVQARVAVDTPLKKVSRIETRVESQTVPYGTPLVDLNLPDKLEVSFEDDAEENVFLDVTWSTYYPTFVGQQQILGSVDWPIDYDVPSWLLNAECANVTVQPPEGMISFSGSDRQNVLRLTPSEEIEKLMAYGDYFPETSTVVLEDNTRYELPISWEEVAEKSVSSFTVNTKYPTSYPCYYVKGTVDFSSIPGYENTPDGTVLFEFMEEWNSHNNQVVSVDSVEDIHVDRGTPAAEVQEMLTAQYPELRIHVDSETHPADKILPILWDVESSNYNRFIEGSYTVFGKLDISKTDLEMETHGEIFARATVIVGKGGNVTITAVEKSQSLEIRPSVSFYDLIHLMKENRPMATITLDDGTTAEVPVIWDVYNLYKYAYNYKDAQTYTMRGILDLSEYPKISNLEGYMAEIDIQLQNYISLSFDPKADPLEIGLGATADQLKQVLNKERPTVLYITSDKRKIEIPVDWDPSVSEFDGQVPGVYTIHGNLNLKNMQYMSSGGHRANVQVTVKDSPAIISDVEAGSATYEKGEITTEELQEYLETNHSTCLVEVSNDEPQNWSVVWDVAASGFNGEKPGIYIIFGEIQIPEDSGIQNYNGYQARFSIVINNPGDIPIVSAQAESITIDQNIHLAPLNKKYELTGIPSTVTPPKEVTVNLDNNATATLPVNWDTASFDPYKATAEGEAPQRIEGEIVIPEDSNMINPKGIKASLDITVTPMDYKVAQAGPKTVSVEVYQGTTLEELNQQLEAEGKSDISIIATNSRNASKRTFSRVFLEESTNPEWNTQKDVCGTYTLTVSWPENISMRTPTRPVVVNIAVTVREPLEIVSTKMAAMDMYQGVAPENAENVPQKVIAVLEDGSEVEASVEWDWSLYNKDSEANALIPGRLTDLPKNAKQPAGEEITASMSILKIPVSYTIQSQAGVDTITMKAGLTLEELTALSQQEDSGIPAFERTFHLSGVAEDRKTVSIDYTASFTLISEANPEYSSTGIGEYTLTASLSLPDYVATDETPNFNKVLLITEPAAVSALEPVSTIDREGTPFAELSSIPEQVLATLDVKGPDGIFKTAWLPVSWNAESYDPLPDGITEDTPITQTVTGTFTEVPAYIQVGSLEPALSVTLGREFDILSIAPVEAEVREVKLGTSFEDVSAMVSHEAVLTLRCTNGATTTQTVSFELREEDNPDYDSMTVGTYSLKGRLSVGNNVKNPNKLSAEVAVRTVKYSIIEAYVPEEDIYMFVGEDPMDYLPPTISALISNGEIEELTANWDMNTIDAEVSDFYVVEGIFELPVYLENPDEIWPMVFVFVDEPDSQIVSMTQITDDGNGARRMAAKSAKVVPGYTAHKYKAERLYKDGTVKEQIITLYLKNQ